MSPDRLRRLSLALIVAAVAIVIDQATKAAALRTLSEADRIPLLGDALGLQLAFNAGATLSIGADVTWLITLLALTATVILVVVATRTRTMVWAIAIGLVLGGTIGNLIDRLFSPPGFGVGHVTDFLAYGDLFIGNLADVFLGMGAILLALSLIARERRSRRERTDDHVDVAPPAPTGVER